MQSIAKCFFNAILHVECHDKGGVGLLEGDGWRDANCSYVNYAKISLPARMKKKGAAFCLREGFTGASEKRFCQIENLFVLNA